MQADHAASTGSVKVHTVILVGKRREIRLLGRPSHLFEPNTKPDIQEVGWGAWTGLIWLRIGTGGGTCECGDDNLGSKNAGIFFDYLINC
jgi:hypothetical protein